MSNDSIYEAAVNHIKKNHEKYDLAYTAFRSLIHSDSLCVKLIEEIIGVYEELSPSIAGNLPHQLPSCTECESEDVRPGEHRINGKYWVQDLYCNSCHVRFGRFNTLAVPAKS